MLFDLLVFIIAAAALIFSSTFLVGSLTRLAINLRLSEFLVGFVLMAVGTSIPELFVGIISALEGDPSLSLGNVVGANIADLSLVIALPILLAGGLIFQTTFRKEEILYTNLSAIAPLILLLDGSLSRLEGAILLIFFVFYMYDLLFHSKAYHRVIEDHRGKKSIVFELALFALGLAVLLASATAVVGSGKTLAADFGIPTVLIGIIILGVGTTLPELAFSIASVRQKNIDLLFGDVMGSIVTNSTLILGLVALISPIQLDGGKVLLPATITLLITLVYFSFLIGSGKFAIRDSLVMIFGYLIFIILEIFLGTLT